MNGRRNYAMYALAAAIVVVGGALIVGQRAGRDESEPRQALQGHDDVLHDEGHARPGHARRPRSAP
ncbi:hypothetical protein PYK79_20820 [Streptomyces sp. ID05-04B]|uniref:hypothetical protein n=1 Tax=unclassified Streptomyces TaxID=2593676 RepID=UPI00131EDA70|nr:MULTISPECIES: hypothetical protein [unclassified Streptomyces]MDX5565259.1 hypothetical protein [Streptomyces sp. ID05-04B]